LFLVIALAFFAELMGLVRLRRKRVLDRREALLRRADRIAAEYTDEVQAWGGKRALLNADVVREIIAAMETEMGSPATP
jgi:hypothetical protein